MLKFELNAYEPRATRTPTRSSRATIFPIVCHLAIGIVALAVVPSIPAAEPKPAIALRPAAEGVAIEAGTFGTFQLTYPALRSAEGKIVHPRVEAKPERANATVHYTDGAGVKISIVDHTRVQLVFDKLPADVKSFEMTMHVDIAFSQGGTWQIAETKAPFPRGKPQKPHLFQGNGTNFVITSALGQRLSILTPDYAFQQLQDNREWNWAIFEWKFIAPLDRDRLEQSLSIEFDAAKGEPAQLVDAFGQATSLDWPGKLKSLAELRADVAAEAEYYASLRPPQLDEYGGLPNGGQQIGLKATGFFHVEQKQGKWWLVDPAGNAFFHLGICVFTPGDDYTYVKGRESIYAWLPKAEGEFQTAYRPDGEAAHFSYHLANMIKKYGEPYEHEAYVRRMIGRVRKFGFNSIGAFSPIPQTAAKEAKFPYVSALPIDPWDGVPRLPGAHEIIDPFDTAVIAKIEALLAQHLPPRASDPLLIGYFIVNEPRYDDLPRVIPGLAGSVPTKQAFAAWLGKKYASIAAFNTAWELSLAAFEDIAPTALAVKTQAARDDVLAFKGVFLDKYFAVIASAYRKHDGNHLLLGSRLQPVTIEDEQLCRIMGKYVDVMSYNYYTYGVDTAALRRYYDWTGGKPLMLSEFFWSSPSDSGLVGGREVASQTERGLAYRNYVEQSAATGLVIGIEWFTLIDQAATGRWFSKYSGESANSGLFSVADRPYKPMLAEMMKTNYEIYPLLLGKRPAFEWDDPRFKAGK